jgi:hypothetical protein
MTDTSNKMSKQMLLTSAEILKVCKANDLTIHEAMVTLGMTLAAGFRGDGLTKHQAVSRFAEVISIVYKGELK